MNPPERNHQESQQLSGNTLQLMQLTVRLIYHNVKPWELDKKTPCVIPFTPGFNLLCITVNINWIMAYDPRAFAFVSKTIT